jgi:hypothetical protein
VNVLHLGGAHGLQTIEGIVCWGSRCIKQKNI